MESPEGITAVQLVGPWLWVVDCVLSRTEGGLPEL